MDIKKLAALARLKLTKQEEDSFAKEFEAILGYVDQIKKAEVGEENDSISTDDIQLMNVMREDTNSNPSGKETEKILSLSPERRGDYIKVKKIL